MSLDEFTDVMTQQVKQFDELSQRYRDLYRQVSDEEIKQRFWLWAGGEEAEVP